MGTQRIEASSEFGVQLVYGAEGLNEKRQQVGADRAQQHIAVLGAHFNFPPVQQGSCRNDLR